MVVAKNKSASRNASPSIRAARRKRAGNPSVRDFKRPPESRWLKHIPGGYISGGIISSGVKQK